MAYIRGLTVIEMDPRWRQRPYETYRVAAADLVTKGAKALAAMVLTYSKTSSIRATKYQNLNVSRLVL